MPQLSRRSSAYVYGTDLYLGSKKRNLESVQHADKDKHLTPENSFTFLHDKIIYYTLLQVTPHCHLDCYSVLCPSVLVPALLLPSDLAKTPSSPSSLNARSTPMAPTPAPPRGISFP